MNFVRSAASILGLLLLSLGYAASQWAYLRGEAAEYAARVDQDSVKVLALVFLLTAVFFSRMKNLDPEEEKP
jgi:hypothetical protein